MTEMTLWIKKLAVLTFLTTLVSRMGAATLIEVANMTDASIVVSPIVSGRDDALHFFSALAPTQINTATTFHMVRIRSDLDREYRATIAWVRRDDRA